MHSVQYNTAAESINKGVVCLDNSNDYVHVYNANKQIALYTALIHKRKENKHNSKSEIENVSAVKQYTGYI